MKLKHLILILAGFCAIQPVIRDVQSCSVPVFRYALERWRPDPYKGVYIYRDNIPEKDRALLEQLKGAAQNAENPLNLLIREVDVSTFSKEKLAEILQGSVPNRLPVLVIWYPNQMGKQPPVWEETLTPSLVEGLLQSPKRRELAESLIRGESVVWVFVPSGNRTKDEAAKTLIRRELDSALEIYARNPFSILSGAKQKQLSYGFPIMTLSRDDPSERILLETLLKSESDLHQYSNEPMVFPVFGRGRVLGCLFGEYITAKHISESTAFLAGACSCEVKELNPGVDLLMAAPWDMVVMDAFVEDTPLPELTGVMPSSSDANPDAVPMEETAVAAPVSEEPVGLVTETRTLKSDTPEKGNARILKISGITLGSALAVVLFAGFLLNQRRKKNS